MISSPGTVTSPAAGTSPRNKVSVISRVRSIIRVIVYGALFIGEETTVAYGDKTIGTNHILPTSRAARYTGGVWVGKFLKTCTYQKMIAEASIETGEVTERQCALENMLAHGITGRVRIDRYKGA
jgi:sulfopropanediol 3-dehydrogenase